MTKDNPENIIDVNEKEGCIVLHLNPNLYSLDVIYSAAYVFLDKAYVLLDGDPKKEVLVSLRPKEKNDIKSLKDIANNFTNELINYSFYKKQAEKNIKLREAILQRVLFINDVQNKDQSQSIECETLKDISKEDFLEDPEGIAIPWDEKYGNKDNLNKKDTAKGKDESN